MIQFLFFCLAHVVFALDFHDSFKLKGAYFTEDRTGCVEDCDTYKNEDLKFFMVDEAGAESVYHLRGSQFALVRVHVNPSDINNLAIMAESARPAGQKPQKIRAHAEFQSIKYRSFDLQDCAAHVSSQQPQALLVISCRKIGKLSEPEWVVELHFERRSLISPLTVHDRVARN